MKKIVISVLVVAIALLGVSYAWFNYVRVGEAQRIITGSLYLVLEDKTDAFSLRNVYPLSVEEARARDDNLMTFSVSGKNTSSSDNIHYEIMLKNGDDMESPYVRLNPEHLVFDLIEVGENGEETYLLDAVSFPSVDGRRIWVDTVLHGTNENIERTYKLRMWVSDKVLISDSDPNADYTAHMGTSTDFKNHYASIKIAVQGDMKLKSLPSSVKTSDTFVENGKSYFRVNLSNDYLLEDEDKLLDENDTVRIVVTNPENKLYFTYRDSEGNEELTQGERLDLTYTYNKNKTITMMVFTESKNDSNVSTSLNFEVYKNGTKVQEYTKQINVIGNNYCLNNGFTKLSDCILVTESLSRNVISAKSYILSKGDPNINNTAPLYTYVEEHVNNFSYSTNVSIEDKVYVSKGYTFDNSTGLFHLLNENNGDYFATYLSNDYTDYYTCGSIYISNIKCTTIYKISSVDIVNKNYVINGDKLSNRMISSLDSEQGLYKVADNYGDSFIYRGAVNNNNVYFGGYYWKILRINGDGTIRLLYNGIQLNSDGNKTATRNELSVGNTYVVYNGAGITPTYGGYMFNQEENYWSYDILKTKTYGRTSEYIFADGFEKYTDEHGRNMFKLKKNNLLFSSTLENVTSEQINNPNHLYLCGSVREDSICPYIMQIESIPSNNKVQGYIITFSPNSEDLDVVYQNNYDSDAKITLESWYRDTLLNSNNNGNDIESYIADNIWCNDRSIRDSYTNGEYVLNNSKNNSGYSIAVNSFYFTRLRLQMAESPYKSASLVCSNKRDSFSVNETSVSNGKLTYPVGLITADEISLAGGVYGVPNENYYLKTNSNCVSMSLNYYDSGQIYNVLYSMNKESYGTVQNNSSNIAIRPVINLNANVAIMRGDGTPTNPYIIE